MIHHMLVGFNSPIRNHTNFLHKPSSFPFLLHPKINNIASFLPIYHSLRVIVSMASKPSILALISAILAMLMVSASSQPSNCNAAILSLSPCLSYITGSSTTPGASCCTQLESIVSSQPQCLCTVLHGGASQFGIVINQTQALAMPGACNVRTPPVSQCDVVGSPVAYPPTQSRTPPSVPSAHSPSAQANHAGNGTKVTPGENSGSSRKMSFLFIFFLMSILSYA